MARGVWGLFLMVALIVGIVVIAQFVYHKAVLHQ